MHRIRQQPCVNSSRLILAALILVTCHDWGKTLPCAWNGGAKIENSAAELNAGNIRGSEDLRNRELLD